MENKSMPVVTLGSSSGLGALSPYFSNGELPKVGQRFELVCCAIEEDGYGVRVKFNLSPVEVSAESVSPVIYRYLRPQDYDRETDSPHNLGGVTFAFVIDYQKGTVTVGTAICDDDWNFDKNEGRLIALQNLSRSPIEFEHDPKVPLVSGLLEKVFGDKHVRSKNPRLAKVLVRIVSDRLGRGK